MLVKRKKPRDDIPTLNELVEDDATAAGAELFENETAGEEPPPDAPVMGSPEPPRTRSAFEITIEAMVSEILNRHVANAREEITRSVLAEVRARLHGGRDKPAK